MRTHQRLTLHCRNWYKIAAGVENRPGMIIHLMKMRVVDRLELRDEIGTAVDDSIFRFKVLGNYRL